MSRAGALLATGVGIVVTGAAAGVALPYSAKTGPSALTVTSSAALVASIGLVVAGTLALVRSVRGWRRIGVAVTTTVLAVAVAGVLALPVAACTVPPTVVGARSPASLGVPSTELSTTTRDGARLSGWYLPSTSGAAVLVLHGAGSTRSAVLDHAVALSRNGFAVLALDARGHGRSAGRAMDWGWNGDADVEAGVTLLSRQPGVDPRRIAVLGLSMGGEESLGAAASDARIRAVVAEGATGRQAADLHWLSQQYGWRGAVQEGIESARTAVARMLSDAARPATLRSAVRAVAPRPVLLVAAGNVLDEQVAAADLHAAAPATVQVWVVPGSDHTGALRTAPEQWQRRVVGFLSAATR
jgi:uncharacterized protein